LQNAKQYRVFYLPFRIGDTSDPKFPNFYLCFADKLLIGALNATLKARSLKRDVHLHQITHPGQQWLFLLSPGPRVLILRVCKTASLELSFDWPQSSKMAPHISTFFLLAANALIPIAILTFASGFFPYKPFLSGLAQYEALEYGSPPEAPFDKVVFMVVDALRRYGH
jgi:hypothetical protein